MQVFLILLNFIVIYSCVGGYSKVNYLAFVVFFINEILLGLLSVIKWSVCTVKSQSILHESFAMTAPG